MKFKFFGTVVFLALGVLLFFASLLGENYHVDELVDNYFTDLKVGEFFEQCIPISIASNKLSETTCSNDNFIFILSILKHFDLVGAKSYTVELKRSHFWIPYISSDTVAVSLSLSQDTDDLFDMLDISKHEYISDLFIIKRKVLSWSIHEISITDPQLIEIFYHFKNTLNSNKYIAKTKQGYVFNNTEIDNSAMTEVDKMLLKYNIQKLNQFLK